VRWLRRTGPGECDVETGTSGTRPERKPKLLPADCRERRVLTGTRAPLSEVRLYQSLGTRRRKKRGKTRNLRAASRSGRTSRHDKAQIHGKSPRLCGGGRKAALTIVTSLEIDWRSGFGPVVTLRVPLRGHPPVPPKGTSKQVGGALVECADSSTNSHRSRAPPWRRVASGASIATRNVAGARRPLAVASRMQGQPKCARAAIATPLAKLAERSSGHGPAPVRTWRASAEVPRGPFSNRPA